MKKIDSLESKKNVSYTSLFNILGTYY